MVLFHYTSGRFLRAIARHGLTVGDVPTDLSRGLGKVGVWLTSADMASGHGLEGSTADKTAYQLSVDIAETAPALVKWSAWSAANATSETVAALASAAAEHDGEGPDSWWIYFGVLLPSAIVRCVATATGAEVLDWSNASPPELDIKGVPAWRRDAWHRGLLKKVDRALAGR